MSSTRLARLAIPLLAFVLAGCTITGNTMNGTYYYSYATTLPHLAAADGPLPVATNGAPFAAADVVSTMNSGPNFYNLVFAADGRPGQFGYRLALDFTGNPANACGQQPGNTAPMAQDPARLRVTAAFCRYSFPISSTVATSARPARSDDPEFRRFLHDIVMELMPVFEPYRVDGGNCGNLVRC